MSDQFYLSPQDDSLCCQVIAQRTLSQESVSITARKPRSTWLQHIPLYCSTSNRANWSHIVTSSSRFLHARE